mgnify:CR=1 FL=1
MTVQAPKKVVVEVDHPLVRHKLSYLRDKRTSTGDFRRLVRELTALLAFRKGDHDQAQNLFSGLVGDAAAPPGIRERSAAMLGVLGSPVQQG